MKIMKFIERLRCEYKKRHSAKTEQFACTIFQVAEYKGQLWFTYNGNNVCPCDMLKDYPVLAVKKMRELYIKNNMK